MNDDRKRAIREARKIAGRVYRYLGDAQHDERRNSPLYRTSITELQYALSLLIAQATEEERA